MNVWRALILISFLLVFSSIAYADCIPNWQCSEWQTTSYGKSRTCIDFNDCGLPVPTEDCVEAWNCTSWSPCSGGLMSRECVDTNDCGTDYYKPALISSCSIGSGGSDGDSADSSGSDSFSSTSSEPEQEEIEIEILAPYSATKGNIFDVLVNIRSNRDLSRLLLTVNDQSREFNINEGEMKTFDFVLFAPEDEGPYVIRAELINGFSFIEEKTVSIVPPLSETIEENKSFIFVIIIVIIIFVFYIFYRRRKRSFRF